MVIFWVQDNCSLRIWNEYEFTYYQGFPGGSEVKASAWNAGDLGSIPGLGRSPGGGNGTPLQYSCLENPMDGGAWWAIAHGVAKSQTWLSDFTFTFHFHALEKAMATHSRVLARRIPGTGSHRVGHDWSDLAVAAATAQKILFCVSLEGEPGPCPKGCTIVS